ncbi:MAG: NYN domain-containing protein [Rhodospirillales bacterium]|nr:NYN domain-containing protein [Rhodospirillales bacterium]
MTQDGEAPSLAVLIDADNTSARYAQAIFEEIVKLGEANVRRIYGDFSGSRLAAWDAAIQSLAILQHQQRNNTKGKNAADIALVIDAMDLLHKGRLDGVCLVSSDSDFTRLAQRLREDGLLVYGFGERKTPEAFRNACSRFIYLENILEAEPEKGNPDGGAALRKKKPPKQAVPIIVKGMEDGDDDGWVHLGTVGSRILGAAPDFDPRTYGCANLSTLAEKSGGFEVRKGPGNAIHIRRKADAGGKRAKAAPVKGGKRETPASDGSASA